MVRDAVDLESIPGTPDTRQENSPDEQHAHTHTYTKRHFTFYNLHLLLCPEQLKYFSFKQLGS